MTERRAGFTLLEMAIVLTIIGLIAGGILVGRDMIRSASIRSTISQVEKFKTGVNAFQEKFGALPGDIPAPLAKSFGFATRGTSSGQGDGNNLLEGWTGSTNNGLAEAAGETAMFWVDLTTANGLNLNLIDNTFNTASTTTLPGYSVAGTAIGKWLPDAKVGRGNYFYVYSSNGVNYYGVSIVSKIYTDSYIYSSTGLTVLEGYLIDKKLDDGLPQQGVVLAQYLNGGNGVLGAAGVGNGGSGGEQGASNTNATQGDATTCYDNGNTANTTQQYSITQNSGTGLNCALSFVLE